MTTGELLEEYLNLFFIRKTPALLFSLLTEDVHCYGFAEGVEIESMEEGRKMLSDPKYQRFLNYQLTILRKKEIGEDSAMVVYTLSDQNVTMQYRLTGHSRQTEEGRKLYFLNFCVEDPHRTVTMFGDLARAKLEDNARSLICEVIKGGALGVYAEPGFPLYFVSEGMLSYLGYATENDFVSDIGGMVENCIHPEDRAAVYQSVQTQLQTAGRYEVEYRMRRQDGSYIWVSDVGKQAQTGQDREAIVSACYDITASKEHERFLDGLVNSLNGDLELLAVDAQRKRTIPVFMSESMGGKQGLSRDEYLGKYAGNGMESIYADDRERVWSAILDAVERDAAPAISFRIVVAGQGPRWISASFSRHGEKDGMPLILVLFTPCTVQYELQQHALSQENVGIAVIDASTHELYLVNDAMFRLLEMDVTDYSGKKCPEVLHGLGTTCENCPIRAASGCGEMEQVLARNGRWFSTHTERRRWNERPVVTIYLRDVTEQYLLQQKVESTNRTLMGLLDNIACGICVCSIDASGAGTARYISDGFCKLFEGTQEELHELYCRDANFGVVPEDSAATAAFMERCAHGPFTGEITYRCITRRGREKWIMLKAVVVSDGKDGLTSYATYFDVTEQMRAKQQLADLAANVPGGISMYRWRGDALEPLIVSDQVANLFGLPGDLEAVKKAIVDISLVHPDDRPGLKARLLSAKERPNEPFDVAYRIFSQASGAYRWINVTSCMAIHPDGEKVVYMNFTDVNQAKTMEERLRQEEALLRAACDSAAIWTWVYDIPKDCIRTSPRLQKDFALPEELEHYAQVWPSFMFVVPESHDLYQRKVQELRGGADHVQFEVNVRNVQNEYHWYRIRFQRLSYNRDVAVCTSQVVDDERVMRARIDLEAKRMLASDDGMMGYVITNITRNAVIERDRRRPSERLAKLGVTLEQAVENALGDILPADRERYRTIHSRELLLRAYQQGRTSLEFVGHRIAEDGTVCWMRSVLNLVKEPATGDVFLYEYLYDIHARRMMEEITAAAARFDYERIASVSLKTDQMTVIALEGADSAPQLVSWSFTDHAAAYVRETIVEGERETALAQFQIERIQQALAEKDDLELIHHVVEKDGSIGCRRTRFSYYDREMGVCLMTRADITLAMRQEEQHARQLSMALRQAQEALVAKERLERDRELLCAALFSLMPMVIAANVTKGTYAMLNYDSYTTKKAARSGTYQALIDVGAGTVPEEQRELFVQTFCKENVLRAYAQGETSLLLEHQQLGDDGVWRWIETRCIFVRDEKSGDLHTITLAQDVTRRKQAQLDLQKALETAENATQAKSEFLSRMSHEIRTPMNAIIGMTAIAKENHADYRQVNECLEKIDMSSHFLLTLINDILEMSRIESGRTEIKHSEFSFSFLIQSIRTVVEPLALKANLRYDFVNNAQTDTHYIGDAIRIQQVLVNIISNAIKFTGPGGRVRFSANIESETPKQSIFKFAVADTGIGMSEAFMKRMFQPFTQEDGSTTSEFGGSGLGLAISKSFVEAMGGSIQAESYLGVGSTFTITLPLERMQYDLPAAEETAPAPAVADTEALAGCRVLMAEDHPLNVMVGKRLLEGKGVHVTVAENGKIAVETFSASAPHYFDAILMDIRMPVMDGWGATVAIRALDRPDAATIPIIAMTANALDEDRQHSRAVGMNEHLAKPFEPSALYRVLAAQIKSAKTEGETQA